MDRRAQRSGLWSGRPLGKAGAARLAVVGASLALVSFVVNRTVRRVVVAGTSMAPTLLPGDRLVVVSLPCARLPFPRPGAIVAVRDPGQPSRFLIKRIATVQPGAGTFEVVGDARDHSTDSRSFGPLPRSSIAGRAVYRYAPAGRSGRGPWPARSTIERDAEPQG